MVIHLRLCTFRQWITLSTTFLEPIESFSLQRKTNYNRYNVKIVLLWCVFNFVCSNYYTS